MVGGDGIRRVGWHSGRVISLDSAAANGGSSGLATTDENCPTIRVELQDSVTKDRWTVALPLEPLKGRASAILGGLPFGYGFGFDPLPRIRVIARTARQLAYLDTTLPPSMPVKAPWHEDGKLQGENGLSVGGTVGGG